MARVQIKDRGYLAFKAQCAALDGRGVKVGVRAGGKRNEGVDVLDYAIWNEFGTDSIPARPFMRRSAAEAQKKGPAYAARLAGLVLHRKLSPDNALGALAEWFKLILRGTVRNAGAWAEPNAPSTVKAKGSDAPLIDDGVLLNSFDYEKVRF